MSALGFLMARRWVRDELDWYVDPIECAAALFARVPFEGVVVDPACGRGAIPMAARAAGLDAWGSDVVQRRYGDWHGADEIVDFFADSRSAENIVSNPPYDRAEEFLLRCMDVSEGLTALLLPLRWLAGSNHADLFETVPLSRVLVLHPRPSMPPGAAVRDGTVDVGGGKTDFAWFVFDPRRPVGARPTVEWLLTTPHRRG